MIGKLRRGRRGAASISEGVTVGQVAIERPGAVRIFERVGIRYCCRGHEALGEACAERGLDSRELLREIAACDAGAEGRTDWSRASATELTACVLSTRVLRWALCHRKTPSLAVFVRI